MRIIKHRPKTLWCGVCGEQPVMTGNCIELLCSSCLLKSMQKKWITIDPASQPGPTEILDRALSRYEQHLAGRNRDAFRIMSDNIARDMAIYGETFVRVDYEP